MDWLPHEHETRGFKVHLVENCNKTDVFHKTFVSSVCVKYLDLDLQRQLLNEVKNKHCLQIHFGAWWSPKCMLVFSNPIHRNLGKMTPKLGEDEQIN